MSEVEKDLVQELFGVTNPYVPRVTGQARPRYTPTLSGLLERQMQFVVAVREGRAVDVQNLLDWRGPGGVRVDPTSGNNYAIRAASENGYLEIVELLLDREGVDPTADHNYAIRWASRNGHLGIVELLLDREGVDPTDNYGRENYAVRWAFDNGHLQVVRRLLDWQGPNGERVDPRAVPL